MRESMSPATGERDEGWHWPRWALGLTSGPCHLTGQASIPPWPLKYPSSLDQNLVGGVKLYTPHHALNPRQTPSSF